VPSAVLTTLPGGAADLAILFGAANATGLANGLTARQLIDLHNAGLLGTVPAGTVQKLNKEKIGDVTEAELTELYAQAGLTDFPTMDEFSMLHAIEVAPPRVDGEAIINQTPNNLSHAQLQSINLAETGAYIAAHAATGQRGFDGNPDKVTAFLP